MTDTKAETSALAGAHDERNQKLYLIDWSISSQLHFYVMSIIYLNFSVTYLSVFFIAG